MIWRVLFASLAATWVMFWEYLPPLKSVHLFSDIEGYHYPLYTYAHQALREGRIPEWDWTIYCGISFIGNPQNPLFYPLNWLVFLVNAGRDGIRFFTIEALMIFHFWLAFLFAWLWLRQRFEDAEAAVMGAGVFAYSGFLLTEVQHLGMTCGYAWYPFGLWGVEQAINQKQWRPLWKTAIAGAMMMLAGYPPVWFVFATVIVVYALTRGGFKWALTTLAPLAFSLLLAMVQLAPALEAASIKMREKVYGMGDSGSLFFYLQYALANFYNQAWKDGEVGPPDQAYLYLGVVGLIGIAACVARRQWRAASPALAMIAVCLIVIFDPGDLIERLVDRLPSAAEAIREWNFMAGIHAALAFLVACGWLGLRERFPDWRSRISVPVLILAAISWNLRQWWIWAGGGDGFAAGWWTLAETAITAAILLALLLVSRQRFVMTLFFVTALTEYKVYGTGRRFNSMPGKVDLMFARDQRSGGKMYLGMDSPMYDRLKNNRHFRIGFDRGEYATEIRHYGLTSPEGFDPFLTRQYRELVESHVSFSTNRVFVIDTDKDAMLQSMAVRYVIVAPETPWEAKLTADPRFRLLDMKNQYFRVFEYLQAQPAYRYTSGQARPVNWRPEHRAFTVESPAGGEFVLREQFYPGWQASVDGNPAPIRKAEVAFQAIDVPAGTHTVDFRYRSRAFRIGSVVSLIALLGLVGIVGASGSSRGSKRSPEQ